MTFQAASTPGYLAAAYVATGLAAKKHVQEISFIEPTSSLKSFLLMSRSQVSLFFQN